MKVWPSKEEIRVTGILEDELKVVVKKKPVLVKNSFFSFELLGKWLSNVEG